MVKSYVLLLNCSYQCDSVRSYRLAPADGVDPFVRFALDADARDVDADRSGHRRAHRVDVVANLRRLENHGDVDIADHEAMLDHELHDASQQIEAVGILPARIEIGKV